MAALTGSTPKNTYKDLLQVSNSNSGVDGTLRQVSDGEDTGAAMYLSSAQIGILTGTAGTPSLAFQPDPNTGIWMNSTAQMQIVCAGVEAVTIQANDKLFTGSNDGGDTSITIRNSAAAGSTDETVSLIFQHVSSGGPGGKIVSDRISNYSSGANEDSALLFYTALNGTDTLALTLSEVQDATFTADLTVDLTSTLTGNVGIGQSTISAALGITEADGTDTLFVTNSHASAPFGIAVDFSVDSPDDNTQYFLKCFDATTDRCIIYSDGDLQNADNSYGGISDLAYKQDISDASSQWDDIKNLTLRNYRLKTDIKQYGDDAPYLLGLVGQEAQKVSPGLVKENGDGLLGLKYSILYMKAVGALQEAMSRIEALEVRI